MESNSNLNNEDRNSQTSLNMEDFNGSSENKTEGTPESLNTGTNGISIPTDSEIAGESLSKEEDGPGTQLLINDSPDNQVSKAGGDVAGAATNPRTGIPIDRGWAWVLVVGCFGMHVIVAGLVKAFGVLFVEFHEKYRVEASALSVVISLPLALMFALGIVGNALTTRFSCFAVVLSGSLLGCVGFVVSGFMPDFIGLVFSFGIMAGLGFAMSYSPCIVMVNEHFRKRRSLANGIAVAGGGIGGFIMPNLIRIFLRHYGLPGCLMLVGGLVLNVAIFAMLFRTRNTDSQKKSKSNNHSDNLKGGKQVFRLKEKSDGQEEAECVILAKEEENCQLENNCAEGQWQQDKEKLSQKDGKFDGCCSQLRTIFDWSILLNPVFWIYASTSLLATAGYANVFNMLPDFAISNGQDRDSSALITSIIGIADLLGRLFFGWFADLDLFPKRWAYAACIILSGVLNCIVPALTTFGWMTAYAVAFGFCGGSFISLVAVILAEDLGTDKLSTTYSFITMAVAIAIVAGPAICGILRDQTGSWDVSFYFIGVLGIVGGCLPFFVPQVLKWENSKAQRRKENDMAIAE